MGEVITSIELVRRLRAALPGIPIFVSTSTLSGRDTAERKLRELTAGIFYAPIDFVFIVRRVLRMLRPSVVVVLETEIWPNLFRETRRTGAALAIVNGRISDRVARRYTAMRWFFTAVLRQPQIILAQSGAMRERFICSGAPPDRVDVGGNLKYDFETRECDPAIARFFDGADVLIAASTTADGSSAEEDFVIEAFRQLPGWKLLLAPRKPERFDEAASKLSKARIPFARRSRLGPGSRADVLLLDTIGELAGLFALARVVFMGGTLVNRGGHNILEPAFFGKPIVVGPHMENFRQITDDFRAHNALIQIESPAELGAAIASAANDTQIGNRARERATSRTGATDSAARAILALHARTEPCYRAALPVRMLLWCLSKLWQWGSAWNRARSVRDQRRLRSRVVSVGNITTGGTGKTPMVLQIAEQLRNVGRMPGILSRGYGRQSPNRNLLLEPGTKTFVGHTGDEPQMFLRSGAAYLGIGADRHETGRLLEERFPVDVIILDDGFQHLRLARDLDIVLIDALDPFGECEMLPLGRLREPPEGLKRADVFVITRSDLRNAVAGIEHRLREINPRAPIFRSRIVPEHWVDNATGELRALPDVPSPSIAFCGLGNPKSFWRTLAQLQIHPIDCLEFGDHHMYTPREIRRIAQQGQAAGIEALLTTEKDSVNLCEEWDAIVEPVKLFWLKIRVEIENEAELLRLVMG